MTANGGEPFALTYGEFDATNPRFSPDGRHIAYISNEGGNTSLWTLELPGARRRKVEMRERRPLRATGTLNVVVKGPDGREVPARLSVTTADGRAHAPDDALVHADDNFVRAERPFEYAYFHTRGRSTLSLPAGKVDVLVTRGLEHAPVRRTVDVTAGGASTLEVSLVRLDDLAARGWQSADLHVHMNYGGHYRQDPEGLRGQAEAEDLGLVFNLIVNKEQRIPDIASFSGRPDPVSTPSTQVLHSQEYHTSYWGHLALLGLRTHVLLPTYAGLCATPPRPASSRTTPPSPISRASRGP